MLLASTFTFGDALSRCSSSRSSSSGSGLPSASSSTSSAAPTSPTGEGALAVVHPLHAADRRSRLPDRAWPHDARAGCNDRSALMRAHRPLRLGAFCATSSPRRLQGKVYWRPTSSSARRRRSSPPKGTNMPVNALFMAMGGDLEEQALEHVNVPTYVLDRAGVIHSMNDAARALVGERNRTPVHVRRGARGDAPRSRAVRPQDHRQHESDRRAGRRRGRAGAHLGVEISSVPLKQGEHVVGYFGQVTNVLEEPHAPPLAAPHAAPIREVLRLLERGRSTTQIAEELHLSRDGAQPHPTPATGSGSLLAPRGRRARPRRGLTRTRQAEDVCFRRRCLYARTDLRPRAGRCGVSSSRTRRTSRRSVSASGHAGKAGRMLTETPVCAPPSSSETHDLAPPAPRGAGAHLGARPPRDPLLSRRPDLRARRSSISTHGRNRGLAPRGPVSLGLGLLSARVARRVGELLHVRKRDLSGDDRIVMRDVGLGSSLPCSNSTSMPDGTARGRTGSQSTPISSPTRLPPRASSCASRSSAFPTQSSSQATLT